MPKAQKRRKAPARAGTQQSHMVNTKQSNSSSPDGRAVSAGGATSTANANRRFVSPPVSGPQSLVFPGMVALGCWGMAYTLMFLTTDPNRYLFGGMAVLMALLWSFSFGVRVRKLLLRQKSRS
jgi:hypothetical protein